VFHADRFLIITDILHVPVEIVSTKINLSITEQTPMIVWIDPIRTLFIVQGQFDLIEKATFGQVLEQVRSTTYGIQCFL
jgi:hypothetical protein